MDVWLYGVYTYLDWKSLGILCTVSKDHNEMVSIIKRRYLERHYPFPLGNLEFAFDRYLYKHQYHITHGFAMNFLHITRKQLHGAGRLHYRQALSLCLQRHGSVQGWREYKNFINHKRRIEKKKWKRMLIL